MGVEFKRYFLTMMMFHIFRILLTAVDPHSQTGHR